MDCATYPCIVNGQLHRVMESEPAVLQILDTAETVSLTDPRTVKPARCLCFYSAEAERCAAESD